MDTLEVRKTKGVYIAPSFPARVSTRNGLLYLSLGPAVIEFQTPAAVKTGLALVRFSDDIEPEEFITLRINGTDIHLLPEIARNLGGALLRKADFADDWQLANKPARRVLQ